LDRLDLPDHLVERFIRISEYDFRTEISVSILGHIFEQSISDIEAMQAAARGEEAPRTGKRKRDGVVYTPEFVTRFIVEKTIGLRLAEASNELLKLHSSGTDAAGNIVWRTKAAERDYWRSYLERLTSLTIVDPACGSGAFLIAAFDLLYAEQRQVRSRLAELDPGLFVHAETDTDVEIITRNLYGVDVNAESVEITRLALWLKTSKRGRRLESLDHSIRCGNSLIEAADYHRRAFVWREAFPEVYAAGGFDVVLGNPPYVRMELLKSVKPYLAKRYAVVADRADLYAYFFELGIRQLKPGGRLGYISSSTFFRTGSGEPLRRYLTVMAEIETIVDFGEIQIFEGFTTYPAIVTLRRRNGAAAEDAIRFLSVNALPEDLVKRFDADSQAMPRSRLTAASWRLESDRLTAIRSKMMTGRRNLADMLGAPQRGIVTGLNEAFVMARETRDALIRRDPRSADLLKPFLVGENLKRWHVESEDLWLIYTPRNRVDIDAYPAIRDHLAPFRARLEARATQQNWWELQQAQLAYEPGFKSAKIVWPHFQNRAAFSLADQGWYLNNKCFFWEGDIPGLAAFLNADAMWSALASTARPKRGGYIEAEAQYVGALPALATVEIAELDPASGQATRAAAAAATLSRSVRRRFGDIAPAAATNPAFDAWPRLGFRAFRDLLVKRCRTDIAVQERDQWEVWFDLRKAEMDTLHRQIADAEAEINARVHRFFELTREEIALIAEQTAGPV
jgi:hypothetical protein